MYTTAKKEKNYKFKSEDEYIAGQVEATGEIDDTQFMGAAVLKNGVMIGKLTGQETRIVNILDDTTNIKDLLMDIPNPFSDKQNQNQIAVRMLKSENNRIKMNLTGARPKILITTPLKLEIMSNPSMVNFEEKKNQQIITRQLVNHLKTLNEDLFKKTQTELKGAPYPLSIYARKYFGTMQEYQKFNWGK